MDTSPKEFLKSRRPHKFSDSKIIKESTLSRPVLENHLLHLSTRNEQDIFEDFIVALCSLEISPNIKPNTGPAGGGDGKTDAESHPVSSDIAAGWYLSQETLSPKRTFAFAISTKEAWESKIHIDLKKIVKLKRKPDITYCVTNRYIKADKRKDLEISLSKDYSTEVHIFDLTWILSKVYDNNRIGLAISKLQVEGSSDNIVDPGPNDFSRAKQIKQYDADIEKKIGESTVNYTTVRDAIDVAVLSREQELPRPEVEGKLARAKRLADHYGTKNQKFMARYQICWTAFWYFEDYQLFRDNYNDAQQHALKAGGINNIEKLSNLYMALVMTRESNKGIVSKSYFESKTKILLAELKKIAGHETAPSSSLYARALLAQVSFMDAMKRGLPLDGILDDLEAIIDESEHLPGFPFTTHTEILSILGSVIGENDKFEQLFLKAQKAAANREGDKQAAKMTLERAKTLLAEEKYYKAISYLGASLPDLHKEETLDLAVEALMMIGFAYERVDLLWAARGAFLNAASIETSRFYKEDEVTTLQLASYRSMTDVELRLGRMPQVIQWRQMLETIVSILPPDEWNREKLEEEILIGDLKLGATILTCRDDASHISKMIPILDRHDLQHSLLASMFRIGRHDLMTKRFMDLIPVDELEQYMMDWAGQAPKSLVADEIKYFEEARVELTSKVLGCFIVVEFPNTILNTEVAESILASVEAVLATAGQHGAFTTEPRLEIHLNNSEDTSYALASEMNEDDLAVDVTVPDFNPNTISSSNQSLLADSLTKIVINAVAMIISFKNSEYSLQKLFVEEKAFVRSTGFTSSIIRLGNVVGYEPKFKLEDWHKAKDSIPEIGEHPHAQLDAKIDPEIDFRTINIKDISHGQLSTLSIIRNNLWDKAGWIGAWFGIGAEANEPPTIGIIFSDPDAASKIFEKWHHLVGDVDSEELIRISIMRNIDKVNPYDYRMGVSANLKPSDMKNMMVSSSMRIHTMNATTDANLNFFIEAYQKAGGYYLTAVCKAPNGEMVTHRLKIKKKELIVKVPSDVGENDFDRALLSIH